MFDPNRFTLHQTTRERRAAHPRPGRGQRYLRGPIPWTWLETAMRLPGKALHVGVAIWFHAGLQRRGDVALSLTSFERLGFDRTTASRGLTTLERAGLVRVERHPGRKPIVTLLEVGPA